MSDTWLPSSWREKPVAQVPYDILSLKKRVDKSVGCQISGRKTSGEVWRRSVNLDMTHHFLSVLSKLSMLPPIVTPQEVRKWATRISHWLTEIPTSDREVALPTRPRSAQWGFPPSCGWLCWEFRRVHTRTSPLHYFHSHSFSCF